MDDNTMSNTKTNPNDPTNPIVETSTDPYGGSRMECMQGGLTKREYFAAIAMQGLLTRVPERWGHETDLGITESKRISEESVMIADELIKALNNNQQ